MELIQGLNKHFEIVSASKTEQDFYMNVYRYFEYIFTHPKLTDKQVKNIEKVSLRRFIVVPVVTNH
jgi:hypothetical protein